MIKNSVYKFCFIIFSLLIFIACHRSVNKKTKVELTYDKNLIKINACKSDSLVLNQIFQQIIDSLDGYIKLNLGKDYTTYNFINTLDSLRDYNDDYYVLVDAGLNLDSIDFYEKENCKITFNDKNLSKRIRLFSSPIQYHDSLVIDPTERVYLLLSRVHFNKELDEACLSVTLSCFYNSGADFAVFAKKKDELWTIKRIIMSSIR